MPYVSMCASASSCHGGTLAVNRATIAPTPTTSARHRRRERRRRRRRDARPHRVPRRRRQPSGCRQRTPLATAPAAAGASQKASSDSSSQKIETAGASARLTPSSRSGDTRPDGRDPAATGAHRREREQPCRRDRKERPHLVPLHLGQRPRGGGSAIATRSESRGEHDHALGRARREHRDRAEQRRGEASEPYARGELGLGSRLEREQEHAYRREPGRGEPGDADAAHRAHTPEQQRDDEQGAAGVRRRCRWSRCRTARSRARSTHRAAAARWRRMPHPRPCPEAVWPAAATRRRARARSRRR